MTFPYPTPVTLISRSTSATDADGNDVWVDGSPYSTGCAFYPAGSAELVQGQDQVTDQPVAVLLDTTVIPSAYDVAVIGGVRYEIDGAPDLYNNPFTPQTVLQLKLKSVTG